MAELHYASGAAVPFKEEDDPRQGGSRERGELQLVASLPRVFLQRQERTPRRRAVDVFAAPRLCRLVSRQCSPER